LVLALGLRRLHGAQIYTMTAICIDALRVTAPTVVIRTHVILSIRRS
jgi:hypothetical protein